MCDVEGMENTLNVGSRYLSANQTAVRAGLTRDAFDQLRDAGKGPEIAILGDAGEHYYLESTVDSWVTTAKIEPSVKVTVEDEGAILDIAA